MLRDPELPYNWECPNCEDDMEVIDETETTVTFQCECGYEVEFYMEDGEVYSDELI